MEAIQIPVNYRGDGTWLFTAGLTSGYYELEVTPHLFLYKMSLPNGKTIEGTIPTLLTKLENYHQDPELTEWLQGALSWEDRKSNYKAWEKTIEFEVEGKEYTLTLNPRTGDLQLHFERRVIVADRRELGTFYPEVYGIKQGQLSELITSIVADCVDVDDQTHGAKNTSLPIDFDRVQLFEIQGWEVGISYNQSEELMMLYFSSRTEKTHISTVEQDLWEFKSLHHGKYREVVVGILVDNGFMDVEL